MATPNGGPVRPVACRAAADRICRARSIPEARPGMSRFPSAMVYPIGEFHRSAIYRFSLVFTAFVFVGDITNVVGFAPYAAAIKYIYTAIIGALLYHYFSRFESVSTRSAGPPQALAFFFVAAVGFVANLLRGVEVSYISAFTASLVFA